MGRVEQSDGVRRYPDTLRVPAAERATAAHGGGSGSVGSTLTRNSHRPGPARNVFRTSTPIAAGPAVDCARYSWQTAATTAPSRSTYGPHGGAAVYACGDATRIAKGVETTLLTIAPSTATYPRTTRPRCAGSWSRTAAITQRLQAPATRPESGPAVGSAGRHGDRRDVPASGNARRKSVLVAAVNGFGWLRSIIVPRSWAITQFELRRL